MINTENEVCTLPEYMPVGPSPRPSIRKTQPLYQHGRFAITKLLNSSAAEIARYDVGEMNLVCALGLRGTQGLDLLSMLERLDAWAKQINAYTIKRIGTFWSRRQDIASVAQFRVAMMIGCLAEECGVRYNPDRIVEPDNFDDPEDSFIHGLLGRRRMGTCASLPVLLVALGRRLGYPMQLVIAPAHCFCRWDAPDEKFNIEWHENGLNSHPDEHYRHWPMEWPPSLYERQARNPSYLVSLTPQQELACFAQTRAGQLEPEGRLQEALQTMYVARELWPVHVFGVWITHLLTKINYPERKWSHAPCQETAGKEAYERLAREKGIKIRPPN